MLDKHSCEMFYTQKLPSKVSQGDTKMRVDLHHGMYGVLSISDAGDVHYNYTCCHLWLVNVNQQFPPVKCINQVRNRQKTLRLGYQLQNLNFQFS